MKCPDLTLAAERIAKFEGFRAKPYLDSVGVPTIGYGTTRHPDGSKVSMLDFAISEDQALEYLKHDIQGAANYLWGFVKTLPTINEWAAMVSLAYNVGAPAVAKSTMLRKFNSGDRKGAADAFLVWDKGHVDGKLVEIQGLLNRRKAERALFLSPNSEA